MKYGEQSNSETERLAGWEEEELVFNGDRVSVWEEEKTVEVNGGQ